jgi:hypothetical protein
MKTQKQVLFLGMAVLLWAVPLFAQSGVPDLPNCEAWIAYDGPGIPTMMVRPDGRGAPFTEGRLPDGTMVDCTVFVRVLDWSDDPVVGLPAEDLWLESDDGELVVCQGGAIADLDTDGTGLSYWVQPIEAGGSSQATLSVFIVGENITTSGLPLNFNSPDLTGDRVIDLADIATFSSDYYGDFHFRSDLYRDGEINLSDVVVLSQSRGATCP